MTTVPTDSQSARTRTTNSCGSATRTCGCASLTSSTSTVTLPLPNPSTGTSTVASAGTILPSSSRAAAGMVTVMRSGARRRGSSGRRTTWTVASWASVLLTRTGRFCCSATNRNGERLWTERLPRTTADAYSACSTAAARAASWPRYETAVGVTNPGSRGRAIAAGSAATVANAARSARERSSERIWAAGISSTPGAASGSAARSTLAGAVARSWSTGARDTHEADPRAARRAVKRPGSGSQVRDRATTTWRCSAGRSRAMTAVSASRRCVAATPDPSLDATSSVSTASATRVVTSPAVVETVVTPDGV